MDRLHELTYLCGCKEGRFQTQSGYKHEAVDTVCDKCRKPAGCVFREWNWLAVAPKRGGPGADREYEEMMMFLSGLVPQLDQMSIADMETVVNRTASQLRMDGFQLFNVRGQIDANAVSERAKRDIVQLVRFQMKQVQQQQQAKAVGVDARRSKNRPAPKQPKVNMVSVGGAGFF